MKTKISKIMAVMTLMILSLLVISLASCKKDLNNSLPAPEAVSAKATAQQSAAVVVIKNEVDQNFASSNFIPCVNGGNGEVVDLSGRLHHLSQTTVNENNFVTKIQFQFEGISGIGQTTGDKYQATGGIQLQIKGSFVNGQYAATQIVRFRIISQGSENDYFENLTFHTTVNANGVVTVVVGGTSIDCK